jgi:hypothetical protein
MSDRKSRRTRPTIGGRPAPKRCVPRVAIECLKDRFLPGFSLIGGV